jgi:(p)ppGpp synthase/HD superfamily hydrolase
MAQFIIEVSLPDRPGSLGAVASAIGFAGGDIRGLQVLKNEAGRGYDEIVVAIPGSDTTDLLNVLNQIGGVEVISVKPL